MHAYTIYCIVVVNFFHYLCIQCHVACDALDGGATPVYYTVATLLSAVFFAGMALIFN